MNSSSNSRSATPLKRLEAALDDFPSWLGGVDDGELGSVAIRLRAVADRTEAASAEVVRRFEKSGAYKADGALSMVAWLRWKCRLSGGAAAERVGVAREVTKLPRIEEAFASGELGYQQAALIARSVENVGAAAVRKEEAKLLEAAQTMDAGRFAGVVKNFEHRVDAEGALAQANRAYARRYLHVSQPANGLVRLDGVLDAEGGATLHTALNALMKPLNNDERTTGQRKADALVELCRQQLNGSSSRLPAVAGQRPHLLIRASVTP